MSNPVFYRAAASPFPSLKFTATTSGRLAINVGTNGRLDSVLGVYDSRGGWPGRLGVRVAKRREEVKALIKSIG